MALRLVLLLIVEQGVSVDGFWLLAFLAFLQGACAQAPLGGLVRAYFAILNDVR